MLWPVWGLSSTSIWKESRDRGKRVNLAIVLLATIGWDWMAVQFIRPQLMPIVTRAQVETYARMPIPVQEYGLQGMQYGTRVLSFDIALPQDVTTDDLAPQHLGPFFCRSWGQLFAGPVDVLDANLTRPDGSGVGFTATRGDCRDWYLQNRVPSRRPLVLLAARDVSFPWSQTAE